MTSLISFVLKVCILHALIHMSKINITTFILSGGFPVLQE